MCVVAAAAAAAAALFTRLSSRRRFFTARFAVCLAAAAVAGAPPPQPVSSQEFFSVALRRRIEFEEIKAQPQTCRLPTKRRFRRRLFSQLRRNTRPIIAITKRLLLANRARAPNGAADFQAADSPPPRPAACFASRSHTHAKAPPHKGGRTIAAAAEHCRQGR